MRTWFGNGLAVLALASWCGYLLASRRCARG